MVLVAGCSLSYRQTRSFDGGKIRKLLQNFRFMKHEEENKYSLVRTLINIIGMYNSVDEMLSSLSRTVSHSSLTLG